MKAEAGIRVGCEFKFLMLPFSAKNLLFFLEIESRSKNHSSMVYSIFSLNNNIIGIVENSLNYVLCICK